MHPQIPGLDIERELGRGASATVYLGRRGDCAVAVKVYRASETEDALLREVAAMATLNHPHIPRTLAVGRCDGRAWMAQQYVDGPSLAERLLEGPLPTREVAELAAAAASALSAAHHRGLVHRDVKPGNLLMGSRGPMLSDFGLAVQSGEQVRLAGTLRYAAPEQAGMLRRPVDARSDLYGLGCVLYECLVGEPPFTSADPGELAYQHAAELPAPLAERCPDAPRALTDLIHALLAKDPEDRPASARELLDELARAMPDLTIPRPPPSVALGKRDGLDSLHRCWRATQHGHGGLFVVKGRTGFGKTLLVDSFLLETEAPAIRSHGSAGAQTPFAAVRQALESQGGVKKIDALVAIDETSTGEGPPAAKTMDAIGDLVLDLTNDGPLVWHIADAQWLDASSRQVLDRLAARAPPTTLLIVLTLRTEDADPWLERLGTAVKGIYEVRPLSADEGRALIRSLLGDRQVPRELADELVRRANGNPLLLRQYVRTVLDSGLLRLDWDRWSAVDRWASRLVLPDTLVDAVLGRLAQVPAPLRRILGIAALLGDTFDVEVLYDVCGEACADALQHGLAEQLIATAGLRRYRFLHGRIVEALVDAFDAAAAKEAHDRIATAMGPLARSRPEIVFARARHLVRGTKADPAVIADACHTAGLAALRSFAHEDAYGFLNEARGVLNDAGQPVPLALEEAFAEAAMRSKRPAEWRESLETLVPRLSDPVRRGRSLASLARAELITLRHDESDEHTREGLQNLRQPVPWGIVPRVLLGAWGHVVAGMVGLGRPAKPHHVARLSTLCHLHDTRMQLAIARHAPDEMLYTSGRWLRAAQQLGPSPELAIASGYAAMFHAALGRVPAAYAWADRGIVLARETSDPVAVARTLFARGLVLHLLGQDAESEQQLEEVEAEHADRLELYDWSVLQMLLACVRLERGYALRALDQLRAAFADLRASDAVPGASQWAAELVMGAMALGRLGRAKDAIHELRQVDDLYDDLPSLSHELTRTLTDQAHSFVQIDRHSVGTPLASLLQRLRDSGRQPTTDLAIYRPQYAALGHACLWRALDAPIAEHRAQWTEDLNDIVRRLGQLAHLPVQRVHHQVLKGGLQVLAGQPERALDLLDRAQRRAAKVDCPWGRLTAQTLRAHVYRSWNQIPAAREEAQAARALARQLGFEARVRAITTRFDLPPATSWSTSTSARVRVSSVTQRPGRDGSLAQLRSGRLVDALLSVSLASATSLEPRTQADNVLGELQRLLGADRALFYRVDPETDELMLVTTTGDPDTPVSRTVLERVVATREALVLTSTEQGESIGAQSVVLQGLRSVIAAPLQVRDRLIGVVYLDSRLVRGMFTPADVELLVGMANHIAIAMEMARAAHLENQTLREAQRAAEAANRAKDQFLANMSHELRTPLNAILGYTEMVTEELSDAGLSASIQDLGYVERSALHLLRTIDDMLDLTRISEGKLEITTEAVWVVDVVDSAAELAGSPELRRVLPDDLPLVSADPHRLEQVMANLLSNAHKFSDGATIEVGAREDGDRVQIWVRDEGIGIAPESLPFVFERFRQVDDSSTRRHDGTGLGLFICRELVQAMEGTIAIESMPGVGTTVRVWLPTVATPTPA